MKNLDSMQGTSSGVLSVGYGTVTVGRITFSGHRRPSFEYDRDWIRSTESFPISVRMPLKEGVFDTEIIAPWIANLLPEEARLIELARGMGLSAADYLTLIERTGMDTAGALSFGEFSAPERFEYIPIVDFHKKRDVESALEVHFREIGVAPSLNGRAGFRQSLAGGHIKSGLAVLDENGNPVPGLPEEGDILAVPVGGAPSTIIMKPNHHQLEGLIENEAFCLNLASRCGIRSADSTVIGFGDRNAICSLRYDRRIDADGSIRRIHQEDVNQALGRWPTEKYQVSGDGGVSMRDILGVRDHLDDANAETMVDHLIFRILVADNDSHAKNHSLLLHRASVEMAPIYDMSSSLMWRNTENGFPQKIAGRYRQPCQVEERHWNRIAEDSGIDPKWMRDRVGDLARRIEAGTSASAESVARMPGANPFSARRVSAMVKKNASIISRQLRIRRRYGRASRNRNA